MAGVGRNIKDHPFQPPAVEVETIFSTFLCRRGTPLWWSLWPSFGPAPTSPLPSCAEGSMPGHSTSSGVWWGQNREGQSPRSLRWPPIFWFSPGYCWLSRLQEHAASSCSAFCPLRLPSPFLQGCSQWVLPACTHIWDCLDPIPTHCTWLC